MTPLFGVSEWLITAIVQMAMSLVPPPQTPIPQAPPPAAKQPEQAQAECKDGKCPPRQKTTTGGSKYYIVR